ncbi:hypothetical protein FFLO_00119 [Filobasidium floriforme]|uniref:RlpA-like protein double-psi beta-barrel domain-containing protein n=1 Tax=Filobasidium floriforme TaxID=5210 RepID=A0A8K0JSA1_9TREE|nr:hypothetical protein FFLO_00119 [Filobasidium floriforme]
MFSKTAVVAFAALAGSVSAAPIEISANVADPASIDVAAPAGWASGYLEDYETFRVRYIAVGCDYHVGQPAGSSKAEYYETCCHPILANQTLAEVRPAYCLPSDSVSAEIESIVATATWVKEAAVTEFVGAASSVAAGVANITSAAGENLSSVTYTDAKETATLAVLTGSDAPAATASSSTQEAVASSSSTEEAASSTYEAPASTSSTYEAPTSTSVYVAPTPTSTYVAPTTSEAPAPAATTAETQNTASTGGDVHYGEATYFLQNGNPGACGQYNSDSTPLVALPAQYWNNGGSSPSSHCGSYIQVTRGDRSVNAVVADLCPSCVGADSIDLSVGAFNQIASESEGMVSISWKFI